MLKLGDVKFYRCPISSITPFSWRLLRLANETTNGETEYLNIAHLPGLVEEIQEIGEGKYREAVQIVKAERAAHRKKMMEKRK